MSTQPPGPGSPPETFKSFAWMIYLSLFAALGFYWFCLSFVLQNNQPAQTSPALVRPVLAALAVVDGALALFWFYSRVNPLLNDTSSQAEQVIPRLRTNFIVCWVITEAVALYGFASAFLTATLTDYAPYFVAASGLLVLFYPRMPRSAAGPLG